ncbi:hypothetical protein QTO34_012177 [Cnephaeus nilssonii]|uniref:Coiled-coil domain-containing protein 62 n=1 Tax=Cnephaeus nilssonii TaxID=3371016 RepID=A0AA40LE43_CNENI|nr:hypothetical protein QTO34_012177 [Eptesicus nilssonii]
MNPTVTFLAGRQNIGSEVEISTIEKQRKELQLLIGELKDRDKELNDMVAVHQRQLLSWEEDRQKVLTLEERCSKLEGQKCIQPRLLDTSVARTLKGLTGMTYPNTVPSALEFSVSEGELHKRTEIIRSLTKKVKTLESNQMECQTALQKTQLQLQEMAQKATHSSLLSEDLEDKDIIEAVNHIADCSGKFKLLEQALRDAKMVETCIVKEKQDYKQKLKTFKIEINKLKEDLNEKTTENNEQREEIIRLKQEKSCLHDELVFTAEREKRKDELLDIAKSKQERTNAELHNLRQIYVKQQSDLQFLNFNVENSQELIHIYNSKMEESKALESSRDMCLSDLENYHPKVDIKKEKYQKSLVKDQKFETMFVQQNRSDKSSCDVCKEKKLQVNTSFGEKSVIAVSSLFAKDLTEKQKSWSLGGTLQFEPENKSTLCKSHAKSPKANGLGIQMEEKQPSETWASSDEKPWHDVSVYLGLADCSGSKRPEKLDAECQDPLDRAGFSCCQKSEACLGENDTCEFSELIAIQHSHCVGAAIREEEKLLETESPSEKRIHLGFCSGAKMQRCPVKRFDDFSPTSKLQRLLAESRQMVTDLELSTLLPISSENAEGAARKVRASSSLGPTCGA